MHFSYLNLFSALSIGLIIFGMALVRSVRAKAILYVLPFPISIGLIATHGKVSGSNLIGLLLIWVFFWLTRLFADKLKFPIVLADTLAAICYIAIGYSLTRLIHWSFPVIVTLFVAIWLACVTWMRHYPIKDKPFKPSALPPIAKGSIAAVVSFAIYSVKDHLAGLVVTFPYNGIFAVIEARHHLAIFSRSVIRNTLAIAALFSSMYYLQIHLSVLPNLAVGWLAFGAVLWLVQRVSV